MKSAFEHIYTVVRQIPRGRVASYGQVAALAGNPRWSRVVGYAMHVAGELDGAPCHRVVKMSGGLSEAFKVGVSGENLQRFMLEDEGVGFLPDGRVDMENFRWEGSLMGEKAKKASDYFLGGRYCSQAVLGAFCEKYGVDAETAFRISCGLNSGCRCADICGAVSGAILVIGLKYGDSQGVCNSKTEEFIASFRDKNGSVICRDILGCDIATPEGKEEFVRGNLFNTICADMVVSAAQILEDSGY